MPQNTQSTSGDFSPGSVGGDYNLTIQLPSARPASHQAVRENWLATGITPNAAFVGRTRELDELHQRLTKNGSASMIVLTGGGGIGKSELAKAYALAHIAEWEGCWWLHASEDTIVQATEALAHKVPGCRFASGMKPEAIRVALIEALSRGRHLLILDNVQLAKRFAEYVLIGDARVIATTRLTNIPAAVGIQMPIDTLALADAVSLLRASSSSIATIASNVELEALAKHFDCHALALAVVSSRLSEALGPSASELLGQLDATHATALEHNILENEPNALATGYGLCVSESLSLHLPAYAGTQSLALLEVASFCDPVTIPIALLADAVGLTVHAARIALAALHNLSIIACDPSVRVHPLTQAVVRSSLDRSAQASRINSLMQILVERFGETDDSKRWEAMEAHVSHANAVLRRCTHYDASGQLAAQLAYRLGLYLEGRARLIEALSNFEQSYRLTKALEPTGRSVIVEILNGIGRIRALQGTLDQAAAHFREAEAIARGGAGGVGLGLGTTLVNLADVEARLAATSSDWKRVFATYAEAAMIAREAGARGRETLASCLNNEAGARLSIGDSKRAFDLLCESAAILHDQRHNHPLLADCENRIGRFYRTTGQTNIAIDHFRTAERISRVLFGDDHPYTAVAVCNIGSALFSLGERDSAVKHLSHAFDVFIRTYGPGSVFTLISATTLRSAGVDPVQRSAEILDADAAKRLQSALDEWWHTILRRPRQLEWTGYSLRPKQGTLVRSTGALDSAVESERGIPVSVSLPELELFKSREEHYYEHVLQKGRAEQFTLRATCLGGLIGVVLAITNLFSSAYNGWGIDSAIPAAVLVIVFSRWAALTNRKSLSGMTLLESVSAQTTASAAAYGVGATLASAIGAKVLLKESVGSVTLALFLAVGASTGAVLAMFMRRTLINKEELPFPSGTASADLLRSFDTGQHDAPTKTKALLTGAVLGTALVLVGDENYTGWIAFDRILDHVRLFSGDVEAWNHWMIPFVGLQATGFGFSPAAYGIGVGMIIKPRVSFSMLIASLVLYLLVVPLVYSDIPTYFGGTHLHVTWWSGWLGAAGGVGYVAGRALGWIRRKNASHAPAEYEALTVSRPRLLTLAIVASTFLVLLHLLGLGTSLVVACAVPILAVVAASVSARSTGTTDTTPVGALSRFSYLLTALAGGSRAGTYLEVAGTTGGIGSATGDLLSNLRVGYLLGANPRRQFYAYLVGIAVGTMALIIAWPVVAARIDDSIRVPPMALLWRAQSETFVRSQPSLARSAIYGMIVTSCLGIMIGFLERVKPGVRRVLPSMMGLVLGLILPLSSVLNYILGMTIVLIWQRVSAKGVDRMGIPTASGLIAGQSLVGALLAVVSIAAG